MSITLRDCNIGMLSQFLRQFEIPRRAQNGCDEVVPEGMRCILFNPIDIVSPQGTGLKHAQPGIGEGQQEGVVGSVA